MRRPPWWRRLHRRVTDLGYTIAYGIAGDKDPRPVMLAQTALLVFVGLYLIGIVVRYVLR